MKDESVNICKVATICRQLFAYRNLQSWPCTIVKNELWEQLYDEARSGLEVAESVDDAIQWANDLVKHINSAAE